jgi:hypothetical protein
MGHYDSNEERAAEATKHLRAKLVAEGKLIDSDTKCTPRSDRNGSCPIHGDDVPYIESLDDSLGFTMETRCGYVPSTAEFPQCERESLKDWVAGLKATSATLTEEQLKTKTTFASGAQKDQTGKPRFDLIPPEAMKALAETYALGAVKYSDRNWEKGIPFSVALGALKRHLNAFELGSMVNTADGDIEHIAHVMWWAVALTTFVKRGRLDLNDLPHYNELL